MIDVAFCSHCGRARAGDARVCSGCGVALQPTAETVPAAAPVSIPTPTPGSVPSAVEPGSTAWPARFVVQAARDAIAYPSLATGTSRVGALLPLLLIQIHDLTREAFAAAYQHSTSAGCSSYLNGPGLRVDPSTNSLYVQDRRDPRMDLPLEGRGSHQHVLRVLDIAIAILDELKEPLKDDRVSIALHVMPVDYRAVVAALERATGQPAGPGWALKACFAAARAEGDHGQPIGSSVEVD